MFEDPEQTLVAPDICIVGVVPDPTVIVIAFEVDVAGVTHEPDGVMIQVTTLPLASEEDVYVLPVPTTVVPTSH